MIVFDGALAAMELQTAQDHRKPDKSGRPAMGDNSVRSRIKCAVIVGLACLLFAPIYSCLDRRGNRRRGGWHGYGRTGDLKQIGLALRMYAADNDEWFPSSYWDVHDAGYLTARKILICPADLEPQPVVEGWEMNRYYYFCEGGVAEGQVENQTATPAMVYPFRSGSRPMFTVLFMDGHVRMYADATFFTEFPGLGPNR